MITHTKLEVSISTRYEDKATQKAEMGWGWFGVITVTEGH